MFSETFFFLLQKDATWSVVLFSGLSNFSDGPGNEASWSDGISTPS